MDCVEGLARLNAETVSVVVTSPPYNIGIPYHGYDDRRDDNEFLDWLEKIAVECRRVLSADGSFFLNVGGKPSDAGWPLQIAERFLRHFVLQNTIIWVKSIAIQREDVGSYPGLSGDVAVGHFKPVNSEAFTNGCFEYVFHFTKNGKVPLDKLAVGVPYQDKSNVSRWKSVKTDRRDRGNTWFIPYETIQEQRPHPSVFPVKLPEMCIKLHGISRTKLVLDPFMGIGTTAIAARRLSVPFVGFEIDEVYVQEAEEWLAREGTQNGGNGRIHQPRFQRTPSVA